MFRHCRTITRWQDSNHARADGTASIELGLLELPQLMDPIGLSMDNFDAVGRWRNRNEGDMPIDAAGALPGGAAYEGVEGLKRALMSRPELLTTTVAEKLLTYALGRGMGPDDAPAIRAIVRAARTNNYRFSSLISGVVKSTPFQMRRSD
jgi:hypothetical protein